MDFIIGLPITPKRNGSICVIVDRFTESAHFLPVRTTYRPPKYADIYIAEIVRLHGILRAVVSDQGHNSTLTFGNNYRKVWELSSCTAQLTTLKHQGRLKG
jgi:hypothetical protein